MSFPSRSIAACLLCGSRELRWPSAADGVMLGQAQNLDLRVCQHGHVGVPLLFENEDDWSAFVASRKS
jgi:hypothetical protein